MRLSAGDCSQAAKQSEYWSLSSSEADIVERYEEWNCGKRFLQIFVVEGNGTLSAIAPMAARLSDRESHEQLAVVAVLNQRSTS